MIAHIPQERPSCRNLLSLSALQQHNLELSPIDLTESQSSLAPAHQPLSSTSALGTASQTSCPKTTRPADQNRLVTY